MKNYVELAKQGDVSAIAYLINRNLQPKGIRVGKVEISSGKLLIELIELPANEPIEDAIVQHVRNGAAKLNIPTVERVEVLQKQKPEPNQTIGEPQKTAVTHTELHSLEDVLQEIKKPEHRTTLGIVAGALVVLAMIVASHPFKESPTRSTAESSAAKEKGTGDMGKRDVQGNTVTVNVPDNASCHRRYVSVKLDTFNDCLVEGMTYVQVANTLGYRGELQSQSGSIKLYQWNDGSGKYLSASFEDGRLSSKSQIGLETPDSP